MLGAIALNTEPAVNSATETMKVRFLPIASLSFPVVGMTATAESIPALSTHPARTIDTLKEVISCGRATEMAVVLEAEMKIAILTEANTRYFDTRLTIRR